MSQQTIESSVSNHAVGVHQCISSYVAFFASEHNKDIKEYDILVVESEGVVGVSSAFPFPVTVEGGDLHEFSIDSMASDPKELFKLVNSIKLAVAEATKRGFKVTPDFLLFA